MTRGRNSQSSRQLVIQQMLQAAGVRGLSPREITEKLIDRGYSVTKRTVHRDIEGLQSAGIPVAESGSKSGVGGVRWKLDISSHATKSGQSAILKIDTHQLAGLYLAKEHFKILGRSPMFQGLDHFFEQVSDLIGSKNRALLDEFSHDFYVANNNSLPEGVRPEVVEVIRAAISEGQCFEARYESAHSGTERIRKFGPHCLYFADGGLYLIAEDLEVQLIKTFAVPRLSEAVLLDGPYSREHSPANIYFASSFGAWHADKASLVEIHFSKNQAAYVRERKWHPSQEIIAQGDGSILLKMRVGITPKLVGWILAFADNALVIAPEQLKEDVVNAAANIEKKYKLKVAS